MHNKQQSADFEYNDLFMLHTFKQVLGSAPQLSLKSQKPPVRGSHMFIYFWFALQPESECKKFYLTFHLKWK